MGLEAATLAAFQTAAAVGSVVVGVGSAIAQREAQQDAAKKQRAAGQEQAAIQAQQAAQERRQQIREERIKRARIMQAAENTGVQGSSGEFGAVGSAATQLSSNIGFNLGLIDKTQNISALQQGAADDLTTASNWAAVGGVSRSIFSLTSGGLFGSSTPATGGSEAAISAGSDTIFGPPKPY